MQEPNGDEDFRTGIPNEMFLPQLHAMVHRRNHSINNNSVLRKQEVSDQIVKKESV